MLVGSQAIRPSSGTLLIGDIRVVFRRGFGFGAGLYRILGFGFAIAFAILITVGQVFAYSHGMRPAIDYAASRRPRLTRVGSFGELWSVLSASWPRPLSAAPSSITWTTPGLLRFA